MPHASTTSKSKPGKISPKKGEQGTKESKASKKPSAKPSKTSPEEADKGSREKKKASTETGKSGLKKPQPKRFPGAGNKGEGQNGSKASGYVHKKLTPTQLKALRKKSTTRGEKLIRV